MSDLDFEKEIIEYSQVIKDFLNDLTNQWEINIEDFILDPFKFMDKPIPKKGQIKTSKELIDYHFHGRGCDFTIGELEVMYDFAPLDNSYIKTSTWKFFQYLSSKYQHVSEINHFLVINEMHKLKEKGDLLFLHDHGYFEIHEN